MKVSMKLSAIMVALTLAGCGGGGGSSPEPTPAPTSTPDPTSTPTPTPTPAPTPTPTPAPTPTPTPGPTPTPAPTPSPISFALNGAVSVITTEQSAVQVSNALSVPKSFEHGTVSERPLNAFAFIDTTNKESFNSQLNAARAPQSKGLQRINGVASGGSNNFFTIDEDGVVTFAASSEHSFKVSYSVVDSANEYLYFTLNQSEYSISNSLVNATNGCAVFKVKLEDNSWSCVKTGIIAQEIDQQYRQTLSDEKRKPLQVDNEGNVVVLARDLVGNDNDSDGTIDDYQVDYDGNATIRLITADGTSREVTSDDSYVQSFIRVDDSSLVYAYFDDGGRGLRMITKLDQENPSTISLGSSDNWSNFFYALDDTNTVIFNQQYSLTNKGINFSQPSTVFEGGAETFSLDTGLFASTQWETNPRRVILADDGSIYGLFEETVWDHDAGTSEIFANLKRVLPYSNATFARFSIGNDWWGYFDNGNRVVQVSKGFAFYLEDETHRSFGERTVVRAVRMADGQATTMLADDEWSQRYSISNWKLADDTLFFSGFDHATSTMIAGEIDTVAMKSGKEQSEFVTIKTSASVVGENNRIEDYELVRRSVQQQEDGAPRVVQTFSDPENIYSATLEFNKIMNKQSVNDNILVSYQNDQSETVNVESMKVWLGQRLHMIFDTDTAVDSVTTEPLPFGINLNIDLASQAEDELGNTLLSGLATPADTITSEVQLRPEAGFFTSSGEIVKGITDGTTLKYVKKDSSQHRGVLASTNLLSNIKTPNHRIEFSTPARMPGQLSLKVVDPYDVDYNNVSSLPIDSEGVSWQEQSGFYVNADKTKAYTDILSSTEDETWKQPLLFREVSDIVSEGDKRFMSDDSISITRTPGHYVDIENNRYSAYWENDTSKLIALESRATYSRKEYHYLDTVTQVKYFYSFGDYRDDNGNTIDDWTNVVWVPARWISDANSTPLSVVLEWVDGYWTDEQGQRIAGSDSNIYQSSFFAGDVDRDGKIDLANLSVLKGSSGVGGSDDSENIQGEVSSGFDSTWTWQPQLLAENFVLSTATGNWRQFASVSYGWNTSNIDVVSLNPDVTYFENDLNSRFSTYLNTPQSWLKHAITITTAESGVITLSYVINDHLGNELSNDSRTLHVNLSEASWAHLIDVEGKGGFGFILDILDDDVTIDNLKVIALDGENEEVTQSFEFTNGNEGLFDDRVND